MVQQGKSSRPPKSLRFPSRGASFPSRGASCPSRGASFPSRGASRPLPPDEPERHGQLPRGCFDSTDHNVVADKTRLLSILTDIQEDSLRAHLLEATDELVRRARSSFRVCAAPRAWTAERRDG